MCDYNFYNTRGTDSNFHHLPIFTKTIDECRDYMGGTITNTDYSQLKNADGYLCLPYCDKDTGTCSSDKIKLNPDGTWTVNGQQTNFAQHVVRYEPKGVWHDAKNDCLMMNDKKETCYGIDKACCGTEFAGVQGTYCDRLDKDELFVTTCNTEGSRSECCNHGTCTNKVCICDKGYRGTCCVCDEGYHKDADGNCVLDDVFCCDQTTFKVNKVRPEQCTGSNNKVVPDDKADNCWPQGKSWCGTDKNDCENITSPEIWSTYRDRAGDLILDCDGCFPPNLFYCDNKTTCGSEPFALTNEKTSAENGKKSADRTVFYFALGILIFCLVFFIIFCINKKKK